MGQGDMKVCVWLRNETVWLASYPDLGFPGLGMRLWLASYPDLGVPGLGMRLYAMCCS